MVRDQIGQRLGFTLIVLGAAALLQAACMKPADSATAIQSNKTERIAQIDAQLANWVPTGRSDDADTRSALRAERARLTGASPRQPTVTTTTTASPQLSGTTQIVVAHDSQSSSNERWELSKNAMDAHAQDAQHLNNMNWRRDHRKGESQAAFEQRVNQQADQTGRKAFEGGQP
jgi:hypothetical protein